MSQIEMTTPISVNELITQLGMGVHEGPFTLITNGNQPNYRASDWKGPAGQILVAKQIEVTDSMTYVTIGAVRYNGVCFV